MLGQEPPQPKLWKACLAAAVVVFPFSYFFDIATMHHRPGWIYWLVASSITFLIGWQTYKGYGAMLYRTNATVWWPRLSRAALSLLPDRKKLDD